jgi:cleavage stimulation factor subunit 3
MTARGAIKDLSNLLDPLQKLTSHSLPQQPTWSPKEIEILNLWKRYISYETSNPLSLDPPGYFSRVQYAYKKALLQLVYFPEIWHDYYCFLLDHQKSQEALQVLKQGLDSNPKSLLISFTLVERLESLKVDFKEIQKVFETLLERLEDGYGIVMRRFDKQREQLYAYLSESIPSNEELDESERRERERDLKKEHDREVSSRVEKPREVKVEIIKQAYTLMWIVYMRLTRRSQSIKAARLVFSKSRKSNLITSHVFVASGKSDVLIKALMEFYVNKDPVVAGKIFEVGLKTFPLNEDKQAVGYVLQYLDFLMCLNDDNSKFDG